MRRWGGAERRVPPSFVEEERRLLLRAGNRYPELFAGLPAAHRWRRRHFAQDPRDIGVGKWCRTDVAYISGQMLAITVACNYNCMP